MSTLERRVALITGTAGRQGRSAALLFAARGARVFGCDIDARRDAETVAMVREAGSEMHSIAPADISSADGAAAWVGQAGEAFGGIDILYNNASAPRFGSPGEIAPQDWELSNRHEIDIVWHPTQAAWPHLVARGGGCIINTASMTCIRGARLQPQVPYGAAKGAVLSMTYHLAGCGAEHRIRANAILPGLMVSPTTEAAGLFATPDAPGSRLGAANPLGRIGHPEDVAGLAASLWPPTTPSTSTRRRSRSTAASRSSSDPIRAAAGGRVGRAPDELDRQHDALGGPQRVLDPGEQELGGGGRHARHVVADRGQLEELPARHVDVVEADDGEVVGHAEPEAVGGVERPDGDDVVGAEDRGGPARGAHQLGQAAVAGGEVEGPAADARAGQADAVVGEHPAEADLAVAAGARRLGAEDGADGAVPERQQLRADACRTLGVVDDARVGVHVVDDAVEQHEWELVALQLRRERRAEQRRGEDGPVDRAVEETVDALGVVAVWGEHDHAHGVMLEGRVERVEQPQVERVAQVVDHDAGAARAARREAASPFAGDVAQAAGRVDHPATGRLGHARVVAQRTGDGRLRDPGQSCDVVACRRTPWAVAGLLDGVHAANRGTVRGHTYAR
jgi:meso-butanediol dehydrogenase/(S,S)-butanediol dehydrogenase/diacetyl reductase